MIYFLKIDSNFTSPPTLDRGDHLYLFGENVINNLNCTVEVVSNKGLNDLSFHRLELFENAFLLKDAEGDSFQITLLENSSGTKDSSWSLNKLISALDILKYFNILNADENPF